MSREITTKTNATVITMSLEEAQKLDEKLITLQNQMIKKAFEFCVPLATLKECGGYSLLGYDSIEAYAEDHLSIKRASAQAYIQIANRFFIRNEKTGALVNRIDERYKDYKPSILRRIASLTDEEIETLNITPDTKQVDVEKAVRALKEDKRITNKAISEIKKDARQLIEHGEKAQNVPDFRDEETVKEYKAGILTEEAAENDEKINRELMLKEFHKALDELLDEIANDDLQNYLVELKRLPTPNEI